MNKEKSNEEGTEEVWRERIEKEKNYEGIKGEERIGGVGEGREVKNMISTRGLKERMKKDRWNVKSVSMKWEKRKKGWWENEEK